MYNQYSMKKKLLMKITSKILFVSLCIVSGCTLIANDHPPLCSTQPLQPLALLGYLKNTDSMVNGNYNPKNDIKKIVAAVLWFAGGCVGTGFMIKELVSVCKKAVALTNQIRQNPKDPGLRKKRRKLIGKAIGMGIGGMVLAIMSQSLVPQFVLKGARFYTNYNRSKDQRDADIATDLRPHVEPVIINGVRVIYSSLNQFGTDRVPRVPVYYHTFAPGASYYPHLFAIYNDKLYELEYNKERKGYFCEGIHLDLSDEQCERFGFIQPTAGSWRLAST